MIAALALALALAPAAFAQDAAPAGDAEALRACLAEAERDPEAERACIGRQALACVDAGAADIAACNAAEADAWEEVLNAAHGDIVTLMRTQAALADPQAAAPGPQELALQRAQATWAAFRDADCALAALRWDEPAQREAEAARCRMERTADRALELGVLSRAYLAP